MGGFISTLYRSPVIRFMWGRHDIETTHRDREPQSSAEIPVRGFGRLSSRPFQRSAGLHALEHGTGTSREPADRNDRATGFMAPPFPDDEQALGP